jgi:cysteine-rich repeat protein
VQQTRARGASAAGNGVVDPGEACDDGNADDCDGCTSLARGRRAAATASSAATEACDDGNTADCDGCSATCELEVGFRCGDGVSTRLCGEECDPPSDADPFAPTSAGSGRAAARHAPLLVRRRVLHLRARHVDPSRDPDGAFDLVAGAPGADGVATVSVAGPRLLRLADPRRSFGYICVRLSSCTGIVDCNGGTPVGVQVEQDSAGPGKQGTRPTTTGSVRTAARARCSSRARRRWCRRPAAEPDCSTIAYPPDGTTVYTTGETEAHYLNGDPRIGTGEISVSGENFSCPAGRARTDPESSPAPISWRPIRRRATRRT